MQMLSFQHLKGEKDQSKGGAKRSMKYVVFVHLILGEASEY
jgi:hypothetical protein